jgi:hypothetical protein
MTPAEAADKARAIAATLNASTFSDNASFVAKCESLIASALSQAVSAEREACAEIAENFHWDIPL